MYTTAPHPRELMSALGDNSLAQFELADAEITEAENFFALRAMQDTRILELEAQHTKNIGLQYLIAHDDTPRFVELLSRNQNVHLEIVPMIIEHCKNHAQEIIDPMLGLVLIQSVFSELNLYKKVFASLMEEKGALRSPLLKSMLSLRTGKNLEVNFGMSGVDTLLFILSYIHNNAENLDKNLVELGEKTALCYSDEINAWITARYPDFADLPLSWVLKAVDFYE